MQFYVRVDEHNKTPEQIAQREATYEAAKLLRKHGYEVDVREWFTGKRSGADAASIVIKLGSLQGI